MNISELGNEWFSSLLALTKYVELRNASGRLKTVSSSDRL
jgi:hypothetical protein